MFADITVLEADPLTVDPEDIPAIPIAAVYVAGEQVR
jgi:Predicted metal-dependent hydrolase with the TIM-barrel fold